MKPRTVTLIVTVKDSDRFPIPLRLEDFERDVRDMLREQPAVDYCHVTAIPGDATHLGCVEAILDEGAARRRLRDERIEHARIRREG